MGKISGIDYNARWTSGNIPIKLRGISLSDYTSIHRTGELALNAAKDYVQNFSNYYISTKRATNGDLPKDRSTIGRGMMLHGPNGTRKTTLAVAILTDVQYRNLSHKVYYVRFADWKRALTDTFVKEDTERTVIARDMIRNAENAHLLVLDDIGQEHRTSSGF